MEIEEVSVQMFRRSANGKREKQEDKFFSLRIGIIKVENVEIKTENYDLWGVTGGHSGKGVSELIENKFSRFFADKIRENSVEESLKYAYNQCEKLAKGEGFCGAGSTLLAACLERDSGKLSYLWIGNSRLLVNGEFMTTDHNCMNAQERDRVERESGTIINDKLDGKIELTRSLGDTSAKSRIPQLIFSPEYKEKNIYKHHHESRDNEFYSYVILATDGFWGVIKKNEIKDYLWDAKNLQHKYFYNKYPIFFGSISEDDELVSDSDEESDSDYSPDIARRLLYLAIYNKGSKDNAAIIVSLIDRNPRLHVEDSENNDSGDETGSIDSIDPYQGERQNTDYQSLIKVLNKTEKRNDISSSFSNESSNYDNNSGEEKSTEILEVNKPVGQIEPTENETVEVSEVGVVAPVVSEKKEIEKKSHGSLSQIWNAVNKYKGYLVVGGFGVIVAAIFIKYYKTIHYATIF